MVIDKKGLIRVGCASRQDQQWDDVEVDETTEIVEALRARFLALGDPASDDVCYAATNRQDALTVIAEESGLLVVVGLTKSSNSVRLGELARRYDTSSVT